jgi:uncharacterized membrane protein YjjB (DUF3815 family)
MSQYPPPPSSGAPSRALTIVAIVAGAILLLPGICAAAFMAGFATDPGTLFVSPGLLILWFICFAISAGGIMLIRRAIKRPPR